MICAKKTVYLYSLPIYLYNLDMVYKYSDLLKKYASRRKVDSLINCGTYIKVSRGIYRDKDDASYSYEDLFLRYSNITLTLQSAIDYYDLSDYVPDKIYIASFSKGTIIKEEGVSQIFLNTKTYFLGREQIITENGYFFIYNLERLLVEIIRFKKRLPYDCYKEVCNSYRELVKNNKIDLSKVVKYAKQITYGDGILNTIMEVIL